MTGKKMEIALPHHWLLLVFLGGIHFSLLCGELSQHFLRSMPLDSCRMRAIENVLVQKEPSEEECLTWLEVMTEPINKLELSKKLSRFLTTVHRSKYLDRCLTSCAFDSHRIVFLKGHHFIDLTAYDLALLLESFETDSVRLEALSVVLQKTDRASIADIRKRSQVIQSAFFGQREKIKAHQILMSS